MICLSSYLQKLLKAISFLLLQFCLLSFNIYAQQRPVKSKPNIIFILSDDIGYSELTVNGGQSYSTPRLDSMARHGINFTHCEGSPLCSPSRFMLLTGKYNFRNYSNWGYMDDSAKTIANVMHDAGYTTGMFGKLQLQYKKATMKKWGWDYHIVFELTEDTVAYRRYKNPVLVENGYRIPDAVVANKYSEDILTQKIFDFIQANHSKPFFIYYSMSIGHAPYCPTPDDSAFANWNPNKNPSDTTYYPSMVRYMDKKVGQILDALHQSGLDKNTIVFYLGDNGVPPEIYYNADGVQHIKGEKGSSTEGGTHVPFIAYWPGQVQPGSVNDDLIDFADFLPTFAQFGKINDLSKYGPVDGRSFYNVLFNKSYDDKQQLFCHFDPHPGFTDLQRWVRDKTYKLYDSTLTPKAGKFYNTVVDEKERRPLYNGSLTPQELAIKQNFKNMLDTVGDWPNAPGIEDPKVKSITNTTAVISANIISAGSSALIDRGSCIANPFIEAPYLQYGRMHDSVVTLGKLSQKRTGLAPQTFYRYSLYAMNSNAGNSTNFVSDSFFTLANPPLLQPQNFNATAGSASVNLNWDNAKFPSFGARSAGYLLIYSTSKIKIIKQPNGQKPGSIVTNGTIVPLALTLLPKLPAVTVKVNALSPNTTYNFMLIPFTWDGIDAATYNYLTENALIKTATTTSSFVANISAVNGFGVHQ